MELEWQKTRKYFGEKLAVKDLELTVEKGETLVLIGPSGCGKTTSLKMINRLVEPSEGSVLVDGRNVRESSPVELRRHIGYVIQQVGLFPHMNVAENVATVPRMLKWEKRKIHNRVDELLELVGLAPSEYADSWPVNLSGGEAQRVGVARALAADPPILLMDEPFGAVDPLTREQLQNEFMSIQSTVGKTVVMVTHDMDEAIRLGDRIAVMNEGELVDVATPGELMVHDDPFIRDFTGDNRVLKRLASLNVSDFMAGKTVSDVAGNKAGKEAKEVASKEDARYADHIASGDLPGPEAQTVSNQASLRDALSLMLETGVRSLGVVSDAGSCMGILTLDDLVGSIGEQTAS